MIPLRSSEISWVRKYPKECRGRCIANRIIVDHVYHRVDYDVLWNISSAMYPTRYGSERVGAG